MEDVKLTVNRDYRKRGGAPLYDRYPMQNRPQAAFIELTEDGVVSAEIDGEPGNAVPMDVHNGRTLRWYISPYHPVESLDRLIENVLESLQTVYENWSIDFDGSNMVGRLNETGRDVSNEIDKTIERLEDTHSLFAVVNLLDAIEAEVDEIIQEYRDASDKDAYVQKLVHDVEHNMSAGAGQPVMVDEHSIDHFRSWIENEIQEREMALEED